MKKRWNKVKGEWEIKKQGRFNSAFFTISELEELQQALYKLWQKTNDDNLEAIYLDTQLMRDELMIVHQRIAS